MDARISKKALKILVDEAVDVLDCNESMLGEDELWPMKEAVEAAKKALEAIEPGRRFPIQGGLTVTWEAAERAYAHYAKLYGRSQSLQRLSERGGFGVKEFVELWYGRKDMADHENSFARALAESDIRPR